MITLFLFFSKCSQGMTPYEVQSCHVEKVLHLKWSWKAWTPFTESDAFIRSSSCLILSRHILFPEIRATMTILVFTIKIIGFLNILQSLALLLAQETQAVWLLDLLKQLVGQKLPIRLTESRPQCPDCPHDFYLKGASEKDCHPNRAYCQTKSTIKWKPQVWPSLHSSQTLLQSSVSSAWDQRAGSCAGSQGRPTPSVFNWRGCEPFSLLSGPFPPPLLLLLVRILFPSEKFWSGNNCFVWTSCVNAGTRDQLCELLTLLCEPCRDVLLLKGPVNKLGVSVVKERDISQHATCAEELNSSKGSNFEAEELFFLVFIQYKNATIHQRLVPASRVCMSQPHLRRHSQWMQICFGPASGI